MYHFILNVILCFFRTSYIIKKKKKLYEIKTQLHYEIEIIVCAFTHYYYK